MRRILGLLALSAAPVVAQTPSITAVLDGGAYTNDIPQGAVFVVKGTNLSAAGFAQAIAPTYPTTLNGVQISLTAASGGAVAMALMVYTYNESGANQLAAVLPSTTVTGAYDLRVTNSSNTSAPFRITVVARKPGIITADGSGSGEAQATLSGALILARKSNQGKLGQFDTRPARPGERVDLWGTGLGADVAADTGGSSGDQTAAGTIRVVVNGTDVTPLYAGRSQGFPGLDQIVFTMPSNVTPGCTVTVQVRAGGVLGNLVTIAVSTTDVCASTAGGGGSANISTTPTQSEINTWSAAGTYKTGTVGLLQTTGYSVRDNTSGGTVTTISKAGGFTGNFNRLSGADVARSLSAAANALLIPTAGQCTVIKTINPFPNIAIGYLDAGPSLSSLGPNGTQIANKLLQGTQLVYTASNTPNTYISPGRYTFSGQGGPDVGAFSGTLDLSPELVWTNTDDAKVVTRANGLTVQWSGGDPAQLVTITGQSFTSTSNFASFYCWANNSDRQFKVPAGILDQLPASAVTAAGPATVVTRGNLTVYSMSQTRLSAPGMDYLVASGEWSVTVTAQYK